MSTQVDCSPSNRTDAVTPHGACTSAGALEGVTPKVTHTSGRAYPHRAAYVLASWRSAHAWIERSYPGGLDAARPELATMFPELVANINALELAVQVEASTYQNTANVDPGAFQVALAQWEAAVLDGLAALANARSSQLCIDCGAEVATVKTGLGQRVCSRCLREGATP